MYVLDRSGCSALIHGDENAYRNARPPCRCADARDDARVKAKRRREARAVPGWVPVRVGHMRRVRGLSALGHPTVDVAVVAGLRRETVADVRRGKLRVIHPRTDRALREVFDVLRYKQGRSARTAADAARKGWCLPDVWVDIDDPAETVDVPDVPDPGPDPYAGEVLLGDRSAWDRMRPVDKVEALRQLLERMTVPEVARRVWLGECTVRKWVREHQIPVCHPFVRGSAQPRLRPHRR